MLINCIKCTIYYVVANLYAVYSTIRPVSIGLNHYFNVYTSSILFYQLITKKLTIQLNLDKEIPNVKDR